MKKFKIFFYPIYLLIAIVALYYSIDILANQQEYMERVTDFATLRKLPQYLLTVILIISLMMVFELALENVHLFRMRKKVNHAEEELLKLKAKLFDQTDTSSKQKGILESAGKKDEKEKKDSGEQENDYLLDDDPED